MKQIPASELILNSDGSIYHLKLKPEHIADNIILVGDPHRVEMVSKYFDHIEHKIQNREFTTHTGTLNNARLSVISTGIGTDNIDIVLNELDAIVNIDLQTRQIKSQLKTLNIIRLGTSGALQRDIPVDSIVLSKYGLGLDGLLNFYLTPYPSPEEEGRTNSILTEDDMTDAFIKHTNWNEKLARPYIVKASDKLVEQLGEGLLKGITITAPGFYGPQGRILRLPLSYPELNEKITTFNHKDERITNFEMETSALYGLGKLLGHHTCTICAIIANRIAKQYSKDYIKTVDKMIQLVLERLIVN
ncbi:nucleoside phosphorylase [bacterium AH-315-M05]|nr:nucleoside phosphorylase [bacterium AH-315-M05]